MKQLYIHKTDVKNSAGYFKFTSTIKYVSTRNKIRKNKVKLDNYLKRLYNI